jgi:DNA-binding NarL/FixJ family response regulator
VITQLHPSSEDRAEARKYGLCWHPTSVRASWACFEPEESAPEPPKPLPVPIPGQQTTDPREIQVTFREYDVAQELFKTGATNTQIADRLYISEDTVKTHMKRLLARTGSGTRSELIVAHYRGRIRLSARPYVGGIQYGMINGQNPMEDAL